MTQAPLLEIAERPRETAEASLEVWRERIRPTLTAREVEVFNWLWRYVNSWTRCPIDATGGELAEFSKLPVTTIRPRLTGLHAKGWIERMPIRGSRVRGEARCQPYKPVVPLAAVARIPDVP